MTRIQAALADYQAHHQTPGNKLTHVIGIPLIVFSLLGLLRLVSTPVSQLHAAWLLIAVATIYYLFLEWRLALVMLAVAASMVFASPFVPLSVLIVLQVAGWILQFIGHGVFEKKRPAFFKNLTHLLIGPLWIANDFLHVVPPEDYRPAASP